jgi:DNA-binding protein HU-beta
VASFLLKLKLQAELTLKIMTKAEVISKISKETGFDNEDVSNTFESFLDVIKDSMQDGNEIFIRGFGSFIIKKRAEKKARDIVRNSIVIIPEHYVPSFRPSKEFKTLVKKGKK